MRSLRLLPAFLIIVATGCSRDPSAITRRYLASGDRFVEAGKYRAASIEYRNAVKASPASADAHGKLAQAAAHADDGVTAATEYVMAATLAPGDAAAQVRAAAVFLLAGRFEEARDRAQAVLAAAPADADAHVVLGEALAAMHDAAKSEVSLKEAVRLAPQSAPARIALATAYWTAGNISEAEAELRHALDAAPDNVAANRALALLMMATTRVPAAEPFWRRVTAARDGSPLALADYYIAVGRLPEAERELQPLIQKAELGNSAALRLATVQHARRHGPEAYVTIDSVLRRDPSNELGQLLRAHLLLVDGRLEEAVTATDEAVSAHPTSARPLIVRGLVLEAQGQQEGAIRAYDAAFKLNPADERPNQAIARLRIAQGHPRDAVEWASRTQARRVNDVGSSLVLIDALIADRNTTAAEHQASLAIERWPRVASLRARLAAVHLQAGRSVQARRCLEDALRLEPDSIEALSLLAATDVTEGRPQDAMERTAARLQDHPNDSSLMLLSARTQLAGGREDLAEGTLVHLINQEPARFDAYSALGNLYVKQGRLDEARSEFMRLAVQSRNPSAATMVGMILEAQGATGAARRQYQDTLAKFPRAGVAANNLACILVNDRMLDEALRLARIAAEELPRRPEANDTLGWTYLQRHEAALAIPPLASAVEGQPDNPVYRYHLGMALTQTGAVESARDELRRALSSKRPFVDRAAATELLQETRAMR